MYVTLESLEDGSGYFDIEVFRPIYGADLDRVTQYSMEMGEGKKLIIKLYDANKNLVLPNPRY